MHFILQHLLNILQHQCKYCNKRFLLCITDSVSATPRIKFETHIL
jgi:hypothetical protein